jgi:hypothetical protein
MSHELRTPLNAIIGLTEMMVKNAARFGTEKAQEPMQRVNCAGTHQPGDRSVEDRGRKARAQPTNHAASTLINDVISTAGQLAEQPARRCAQENLGALTVDPMRLRQTAFGSITAQFEVLLLFLSQIFEAGSASQIGNETDFTTEVRTGTPSAGNDLCETSRLFAAHRRHASRACDRRDGTLVTAVLVEAHRDVEPSVA